MRLRLSRELLDDDAGAAGEIARSLDDLWWINRHLGGTAGWRRLWPLVHLRLPRERGRLTLLDVGSGDGRLAAFHAEWWRAHGREADLIALDRRGSHLTRAGNAVSASLPKLVADALRLPFADASIDVVSCNLFLHHFHDAAAAEPSGERRASQLLAEMRRVARYAVVINDLERSWWPWLGMCLLGLRCNRMTRCDGRRSVRQAYTFAELEHLGRFGGAGDATVIRLPLYRLGLILWNGAPVAARDSAPKGLA